jgi:hypothetical protein
VAKRLDHGGVGASENSDVVASHGCSNLKVYLPFAGSLPKWKKYKYTTTLNTHKETSKCSRKR